MPYVHMTVHVSCVCIYACLSFVNLSLSCGNVCMCTRDCVCVMSMHLHEICVRVSVLVSFNHF